MVDILCRLDPDPVEPMSGKDLDNVQELGIQHPRIAIRTYGEFFEDFLNYLLNVYFLNL